MAVSQRQRAEEGMGVRNIELRREERHKAREREGESGVERKKREIEKDI